MKAIAAQALAPDGEAGRVMMGGHAIVSSPTQLQPAMSLTL